MSLDDCTLMSLTVSESVVVKELVTLEKVDRESCLKLYDTQTNSNIN